MKGRTSGEMVAEMAAGARLVKSISNIPMDWIQDFSPNKPRTVIFTSGGDIEAKNNCPAWTSTSSADFGENGSNTTVKALLAPNINKAYRRKS